ncbi:MAG: hypothetical protein ACREOG_07015, partial [Gemmatimonadaceae bacterium]
MMPSDVQAREADEATLAVYDIIARRGRRFGGGAPNPLHSVRRCRDRVAQEGRNATGPIIVGHTGRPRRRPPSLPSDVL